MKKTLVFYIRLETQFKELIRLYNLLSVKLQEKVKLQILFEDIPTHVLENMVNYCIEKKINYNICKSEELNTTVSFFQKIKITLCMLLGGSPTFLSNLYKESNYFHSYFTRNNVKLIFVGEDGVGTTPALFYVAKKKNILCISVPYEYSTKTQVLESIIHDVQIQLQFSTKKNIHNKIIALLFPKWNEKFGKNSYLRLPANLIISMLFFNFHPKLPWAVHGGHSLKLFCDSKAMQKFYINEGIDKRKIVLTGNLGHDEMLTVMRNNPHLLKAYQTPSLINKSKTRILFAFPPDYTTTRNKNYNKYTDLVDFWLDLSKSFEGIEIYYQLHPSVGKTQAEYIKSKGIILEYDNIVELIPKIDVLVTSVSSIIRLAVAARKPILNYDVYNFNYPDYCNVNGVITVDNPTSFRIEFKKISTNPSYVNSLKQQMKFISDDWGILDGKACKRILAIIENFI